MQLRFTAYNCGTGYDRNRDDVVGQLNKETISLHMITDGVGSVGHWVGKAKGLLGAVGVDANVSNVVDRVKQLASQVHSVVLNMCGWSRGAVTCFKIANALYQEPLTAKIEVRIFAIDPVPGGSSINNHMWQGIDKTKNIKGCSVILSQHDRRWLFQPFAPPVLDPLTYVDLMPGDHSTIVEYHAGRSEAYELVKDMAKKYLTEYGTVFRAWEPLSKEQILKRYGAIALHFDDYAHFAKGAPNKWEKRFQSERAVRDPHRKVILHLSPQRPQFFFNLHHRKAFSTLFPRLTQEIDQPPQEAFSDSTQPAWMPELDRMMGPEMGEQGRMVVFYIWHCQNLRERGLKAA